MILDRIAVHNGFPTWEEYKLKSSKKAKRFSIPLYIKFDAYQFILQQIKDDKMKLVYRDKTNILLLMKE